MSWCEFRRVGEKQSGMVTFSEKPAIGRQRTIRSELVEGKKWFFESFGQIAGIGIGIFKERAESGVECMDILRTEKMRRGLGRGANDQ